MILRTKDLLRLAIFLLIVTLLLVYLWRGYPTLHRAVPAQSKEVAASVARLPPAQPSAADEVLTSDLNDASAVSRQISQLEGLLEQSTLSADSRQSLTDQLLALYHERTVRRTVASLAASQGLPPLELVFGPKHITVVVGAASDRLREPQVAMIGQDVSWASGEPLPAISVRPWEDPAAGQHS